MIMTTMNKWLVVIMLTMLIASGAMNGTELGQGDALMLVFLTAAILLGAVLFPFMKWQNQPLTQLRLTYSPYSPKRLATEIISISESGKGVGRVPEESKVSK